MKDDPLHPVEVEGLSWCKGDLAVEPLSFHVAEGEILIVAGNSGCGKSSLLRHLCGLDRPDDGSVRLLGRDILGMGEAARIEWVASSCALMFQHGALLGSHTLLENTALPAAGAVRHERPLLALASQKLRDVGLGEECDGQYPGRSSGGQRKRASLARALLLDRPILLCDEPTSGLHPSACAGLDRLLGRLRDEMPPPGRRRRSMIVVTHDPDMIERIGDRMLVLRREGNESRPIYLDRAQRAWWTPAVRRILDRRHEDVG
jgi:phospholipid/cholesterol/gamma-HCH transport system ATP-binding protein